MKKQVITKEQAISEIRNLFDISDEDVLSSYENEGGFGINKSVMERHAVINTLQDYFSDKVFEKGLGLEVCRITILFTTFKIIDVINKIITQE
jgi:hypothetical protein